MVKYSTEFKIRLWAIGIGLFLIGSAYFLSGDWRREYHEDGWYTPNPVLEFDVYKKDICSNCVEQGLPPFWLVYDSNFVLGMLGTIGIIIGIAPMRYTRKPN